MVTPPPPAPPGTAPIFDIPGYRSGDQLELQKGSRAAGTGIGGRASLDYLGPDGVDLTMRAGKL